MAAETQKITAKKVFELFSDHLQKHEDYYDPTIKNNKVLLVGEKNDDGICSDIQLIKAIIGRIENTERAIFVAVLTAIVVGLIK